MKLEKIYLSNSLNKAYLAQCPFIDEINLFKDNYSILFKSIKTTDNEETIKDYLNDFLKNTYYKGKFVTKENINNIDLVILNGKNIDDKIGVIIETKAIKSNEMITENDLNKKAFHELIQYYLEERIINQNIEIKHLIITNSIDWYIFNATEFERLFYQNKSFLKKYNDWYSAKLVSKNKDWFYSEIAKPFVENSEETIVCTYFQLCQSSETLAKLSDQQIIEIYKIFSPEHLLKLPFRNDSNSLNREFYNELLHIIGLQETKVNNIRKIERLYDKDRNYGSLIENTINILQTDDILHNINEPERFGETQEEQLFSIGLELCITWLNRILFLKLLESQLVKYNNSNKDYYFLNSKKIRDFEELRELFFEVLAVKPIERKKELQTKYEKIPYLNSSLFEQTSLEKETIKINQLKNHYELPISQNTVLRDDNGKQLIGTKPILKYIFDFLESYNFASDNKVEIQEKNKTIINSSVLGLIFEKLNGYKDGSFFTPGFITMYLCRETIRNAVIEKFRESNLTNFKKLSNFTDLYNKISKIPIKKANEIFNSIKICDPAVGSGHFLVSALNELIAIKSELEILADEDGKLLRNVKIEIENDELFISVDSELFTYNYKNNQSQRIQETIFHEKQILIENCLFGVDINPKSVNICRLRLWIELLKNAYYKIPAGFKNPQELIELQTLPNIDINIKCGNSLISHFSLNGNGGTQSLKLYTQKYKEHVKLYKNETDRNAKREYEKQIKLIKEHFAKTVNPKDEDLKKIRVIESEIGLTPMFFNHDEQVQWNIKHQRLENERVKLQKNYEEKLKTVYNNAFEWRFEFPEVLDENGYFVGFDAIIGNPPYIEIRNIKDYCKDYYNQIYPQQKNCFDLYTLFIQKSLELVKKFGFISYIVPKPILYNSTFKSIRKIIFENSLHKIYIPDKLVFEKASVETVIIFISKGKNDKQDFIIKDNFKEFKTNISTEYLLGESITISDNKTIEIISKLNKLNKLFNYVDIIRGLELGKNTLKQQSKKNQKTVKIFAGEAFNKYIFFEEKYIYINNAELEKYYKIADKKFVEYPRIIMRRVSQEPILTIISKGEDFINNLNSVYNLSIINPLKIKNEFLIGVLNSKLIKFYIQKKFSSEEKIFPYLRIEQIKDIPFIDISIKDQNPIIKLVEKIIEIKQKKQNIDTSELETEIDKITYKLYNLTEEEIKIIEK